MHILALILVVIVAAYCTFGGGGDSVRETARSCSPGDIMASIMAANFVKRDHLRSPSTAKFGPHRTARILDLGECRYMVRHYVDAQNAFGATVRQYYSVEIEKDLTTNNWRRISVSMDQ